MPYQGLKPAISKAKDRFRAIVRGKQAQPTNSSPYAMRHANFSVRGIAQSIKGMVSDWRVDQTALESVAEDTPPLLPDCNGPVPIITSPDNLGPEFKRELESAASTANAAVLEKLAASANVVKELETRKSFSEYSTIAGYLEDYGIQPRWIKTFGPDRQPFLLVDPLRMNAPERTEEEGEEENKKGKTPIYKVGKPSEHVMTSMRKTCFPQLPTFASRPSHPPSGTQRPRQAL
ncbi:hypothetical protein BKA80DRAFT_346780 [Phyllosticta citrichinensis]